VTLVTSGGAVSTSTNPSSGNQLLTITPASETAVAAFACSSAAMACRLTARRERKRTTMMIMLTASEVATATVVAFWP